MARFFLIACALFVAYAYPYGPDGWMAAAFERYLGAYARLVAGLLAWFDASVRVEGATIEGRTALRIVKSCDAMEVKLLLASAVLAYPAPWRRRLIALITGLCVLVAINVARIVTLYYVRIGWEEGFEVLHLEVLPLVMVGATVVLFIASVRFMGRPGRLLAAEPADA